jgi:hypothetical protein
VPLVSSGTGVNGGHPRACAELCDQRGQHDGFLGPSVAVLLRSYAEARVLDVLRE